MTEATIGHNNPPPDAKALASEHIKNAGLWLAKGTIKTAEQAEKLPDVLTGLREVYKAVDAERKAKKQPHDDAAKAVQEEYKPTLDALTECADRLKKMATDWAVAEKRRMEAEAAAQAALAREEAERAQAAAEAAAMSHDVEAELEAQAQWEAAEERAQQAAKPVSGQVKSATGAGRTIALRVTKSAKLTSYVKAVARYQRNPELHAFLERLATAELRAKGGPDEIAGFEIIKTENAA
jgi:hypothetical protein